jgi:hypothetical protein
MNDYAPTDDKRCVVSLNNALTETATETSCQYEKELAI